MCSFFFKDWHFVMGSLRFYFLCSSRGSRTSPGKQPQGPHVCPPLIWLLRVTTASGTPSPSGPFRTLPVTENPMTWNTGWKVRNRKKVLRGTSLLWHIHPCASQAPSQLSHTCGSLTGSTSPRSVSFLVFPTHRCLSNNRLQQVYRLTFQLKTESDWREPAQPCCLPASSSPDTPTLSSSLPGLHSSIPLDLLPHTPDVSPMDSTSARSPGPFSGLFPQPELTSSLTLPGPPHSTPAVPRLQCSTVDTCLPSSLVTAVALLPLQSWRSSHLIPVPHTGHMPSSRVAFTPRPGSSLTSGEDLGGARSFSSFGFQTATASKKLSLTSLSL